MDGSTLPKWHHRHEPVELAETTFGPLDKYVPANDNHQGGTYIGLRRSAAQSRTDFENYVEKWRQDDSFAYRQEQGLEALTELKGFVYLGSPYAKYDAGLEEAARVVTACAGTLMKRGMNIFCPITHGHAVTRLTELPRDWDYWKNRDQPFIDAAEAILVVTMRGWQDSVGLTYEIDEFFKAGKPMMFISPADLGVEEAA
jgi:hypothetical protein